VQKNFLLLACLFAALAVVLGAFGAHGLKTRITPDQLQTFETGVKYQFYHALALLAVGLLLQKYSSISIVYAGYCFAIGILFFSGSIYLLATRDFIGLTSWRWLGPITPLGGTFFIVGWLLLLWGIWKGE
jgi:uncharacterized membrane protein YgdD (TMEM256/DUF423 family)